jgi:phosphate transport system substrate-binding protein
LRGCCTFLALLAFVAAGCGASGRGGKGGATTLVGAGSTLVAPLVAKWSEDYSRRAGVTVTYGAIGSGGGIAQIISRSVDFGGSDAPLTPEEARSCGGCLQIPWALGATLVSYHVKGAPARLKLSGPVLARIFLGTVKRWDDTAIARLNPGKTLPSRAIQPVYRSDGSGDTYAFSDFLAKTSPEWQRRIGVSTQASFPVGVGARGSEGVAAALSRMKGGIGYLAFSYVFANDLDYALVENGAGKFPRPGIASISAAAKTVANIAHDNRISITNPPASAPDAYPISTFTYALVPKNSSKASPLRSFLNYAITAGQRFGGPLQFAALPSQILAADRRTIAEIR